MGASTLEETFEPTTANRFLAAHSDRRHETAKNAFRDSSERLVSPDERAEVA